jgi:hypothetical protein
MEDDLFDASNPSESKTGEDISASKSSLNSAVAAGPGRLLIDVRAMGLYEARGTIPNVGCQT